MKNEKCAPFPSIERTVASGCQDPSFFPSIGLKVTAACRFACPFCCEPDRGQRFVPVEDFISITNILRQAGTQRLCLTGGEPLLYPNITTLLKHTKHLGFYNLLLTADAESLIANCDDLSPFVDAVRLSVHGLGSQHDDIVGHPGVFQATERAIDILTTKGIPIFVTTVVTALNVDSLSDISNWCVSKTIQKHFLFGLMRSGLGDMFIKKYGDLSPTKVDRVITEIKHRYPPNVIDIIYYDYSDNAECVLIYGDGRVVIDPYASSKSFQLEIGNILVDSPAKVLGQFFRDPNNYEGYCKHLNMYNKMER